MKLARQASITILSGLAASLLHRPQMANAISFRSRVPLPTTPGGVHLTTIKRQVSQPALLFVWALFFLAAVEWNGFGYFRHLACRIRNLGKEQDDLDVGLAKESDWDSYSHLLDPLQKRNKISVGSRVKNWVRRFNRSKDAQRSNDAMQKANKIFQEKQYEQHHHLVHVSRSKADHPTYLDSLSKCSSVDPDAKGTREMSYLDSLSDLKATKSTWADYKIKVDRVNEEKIDAVEELRHEVSTLQNLMNMEQSMYQTSNQALKLTVDAQKQQLQYANEREATAVKDLKDFDKMAEEYKETVGREITSQEATGTIADDDVRSILYEL